MNSSTNHALPRLIVIVGPTASGKSALALEAAEILRKRRGAHAEIVSADSRQIYRGMNIGTAKPTHAEQNMVPHHLIDVRNPDEPYTVADYQRDACAAIDAIIARGNLPLLVGGTGLYIRAITENLAIPTTPITPANTTASIRTQIEHERSQKGLDALFEELVVHDPDAKKLVDRHNPRRVVRALEVVRATGKPFTAQQRTQPPRYQPDEIGIDLSRELLRERITARINTMMENDALINETRSLIAHFGENALALDAIGYREAITYLNGASTREEMIRSLITNTARYAKRQMTWFKKDKKIRWFSDRNEALAFLEKQLMEL